MKNSLLRIQPSVAALITAGCIAIAGVTSFAIGSNYQGRLNIRVGFDGIQVEMNGN